MVSAGTVTIAVCFWSFLYQSLVYFLNYTLRYCYPIPPPLIFFSEHYCSIPIPITQSIPKLRWNSYSVLYTFNTTNNLLNISYFYWPSCPGCTLFWHCTNCGFNEMSCPFQEEPKVAVLLSRVCSSLGFSSSKGSVYWITLEASEPGLKVVIDAHKKVRWGTVSPDGPLPADSETGEFESKDFGLPLHCHKTHLLTL